MGINSNDNGISGEKYIKKTLEHDKFEIWLLPFFKMWFFLDMSNDLKKYSIYLN